MIDSDRAEPPLILHLFGSFEARVNGRPLPQLRTRKGQSLLAFLALRAGSEVERTWLAGVLWPDSAEVLARHSLRTSLADLRRALGAEAGLLRSLSRRALALDPSRVRADVLVFDAAVTRGDVPALEEAVAVYRGPLLEGWTEEWVFQERQSREQAYLSALEALAAHAVAGGKLGAAEQYLRRAAAVDPLRETAQREMIRALAAGGNYAAALRVYRELRSRLRAEVNAEPDPETQRLFQQIRAEARAKAGDGRQAAGGRRQAREGREAAAARQTSAGTREAGGYPAKLGGGLASAPRHNLPQQVTSFVGRDKEMAEVRRLLGTTRLLTLTGPGGTGKTRLSLQVAAELGEEAGKNVRLVELAPLAAPPCGGYPALVAQAVATALGIREEPGRPLSETLIDFLNPQRLLIILDNCEHLLPDCAELAGLILRNCPGVRILATSREGLNVSGETTYPLPPLSVPGVQAGCPLGERSGVQGEAGSSPEHLNTLTPERLMQYEAVRLFADRAAAGVPSFAVTHQNAPALAQLCVRLDGIPLAIELAAARVKAMSVEQINQRLSDGLGLLTRGSRTALPRHQTLKAAIDWSYELLSPKEKLLLRRLSLFAGGWSLEAAEQVCSDSGWSGQEFSSTKDTKGREEDLAGGPAAFVGPSSCPFVSFVDESKVQNEEVLELLCSLVDKSLVLYEEDARGNGRYRLLETVRQYGCDRLREAGETAAVRDRHLEFFLRWAEKARDLSGGGDETAWFDHFEQELDNLRAALEWSAAAKARTQQGLRLMVATHGLWVHEHSREGRERLIRLLEQSDDLPDKLRADALMSLAWLSPRAGDAETARSCLEQSRALYRALDDPHGVVATLLLEGIRAQGCCELPRARSLFKEARSLSRQSGDVWAHVWSLLRLGETALAEGDRAEARAHFEQSVAFSRERSRQSGWAGWSWVIGEALGGLAAVAVHEGDLRQAESLIQERLTHARANGASLVVAYALLAAGSVLQLQGRGPESRARYEESLALARTIPDLSLGGYAFCNLASLEVSEGSLDAAAGMLREALRVCRGQANRRPSLRCLEVSARWAHAQGRLALAARLFSAIASLRDAGRSSSPVTDAGVPAALSTRAEEAAAIEAVRVALGKVAFVSAWTEGQAMGLEDAIRQALDGLDSI